MCAVTAQRRATTIVLLREFPKRSNDSPAASVACRGSLLTRRSMLAEQGKLFPQLRPALAITFPSLAGSRHAGGPDAAMQVPLASNALPTVTYSPTSSVFGCNLPVVWTIDRPLPYDTGKMAMHGRSVQAGRLTALPWRRRARWFD